MVDMSVREENAVDRVGGMTDLLERGNHPVIIPGPAGVDHGDAVAFHDQLPAHPRSGHVVNTGRDFSNIHLTEAI
jgi:hypothetical protein